MTAPRRGSLVVIFLTVFIDLLGFGIVLPLLPIYGDTLGASGWELGLLMASFSAMQFVFSPLWGRLSDRIGRRPVLMLGLASSVVFYGLFGVATIMQSLTLLMVARFGAGIAGATISTAQAYISDTTTLENRSKGMALIGMAFGLGFTFGPLLGFLAVPRGEFALVEGGLPPQFAIPGFAAAGLSLVALLSAVFLLPESRHVDSESAARHWLDQSGLKAALRQPSIGMLLIAIFVCVFSFANFETTLSLLIKGSQDVPDSPFSFSWGQVCLTYSYIGLTLALVQGGVVRRLADRVHEGVMASLGAAAEIVGFLLVAYAIVNPSSTLLLVALAIVVSGFAFMQPSLNALLSRRTDPSQQGAVLGIGQSVNSLARIAGAGLGIPLLKYDLEIPYYLAAGLMGLGLLLVIAASRAGKDFIAKSSG